MSEKGAIVCCLVIGIVFVVIARDTLSQSPAKLSATTDICIHIPDDAKSEKGGTRERQRFAWPISEADYRKAVVCDLHPAVGAYADESGAHVHCPEELNGGAYRNGKFVYLKDVAQ